MPLVVKDFTWDQNDTTVFVTVPLKGVKANKVDIFSSEEYLKVSYPPYIFECLLEAPVDDETSTAQVGNGAVLFKLKKKDPAQWSNLQSEQAADKDVMRQKRQEAIETAHTRSEEATKKKAEQKRLDEKYTINEIMNMEAAERQRIEDLKESERKKATEELEKWKDEQRHLAEEEKARLLQERKAAEEAKRAEQKVVKRSKKKGNIFDDVAQGISTRESGHIEISFTPRVFPTPIRESQTPLEEEWLKKQAEAARVIEIADKDLSEEEKNPLWLRDKGNSFFQAGNYKAAVNVYSHAIRLNSKLPALYSNRSACHLKLRNFFKCIDDCSKALELLTPPVPQNANSRCKALVRRGTAFCELEMYIEGLQDYESALKLQPNGEQLQADADRIRQIIQGSTES
ncbi:dynein assembly factor 4, axonemal-like [Gigantopelta aegis]|uniref:dynein assembly factor 4, axonemal-like n=1 Tax=Gigantopelta aegis TaxID=1735272 RepID=UPI001B88D9BF|nr:dynein assembly factor 4, axonemal-like [Gigantopelta aegis]